jgi:O-acetyl-ADP-ribose deacetylase (regulator of RNase III)
MATRIELHLGDSASFEAEAIVTAVDSSLFGGEGVDGEVHRVGGPIILKETQLLREVKHTDGLPDGEAVSTNAGNLPAKWVIHTVGPEYSPEEDHSETLASCYIESIELADKLSAQTISFPAIGVGAYGWPLDEAARIAMDAIRSTDTHIELVTFVLDDEEAMDAFGAALLAEEE